MVTQSFQFTARIEDKRNILDIAAQLEKLGCKITHILSFTQEIQGIYDNDINNLRLAGISSVER